MIVIEPVTIGAGQLVSSTIAEPDTTLTPAEQAWSSGATYAEGDRRVYAHGLYESLQSANTNHAPVTNGDPDSWWVFVQPSNRFAALDAVISTLSKGGTGADWVISPGARINAVAAINITGDTVSVSEAVSGYSSGPVSLRSRIVRNWREYYYAPPERRRSAVFLAVPSRASPTVTVAFDGTNNAVTVGALVLGRQTYIGSLSAGAKISIQDFSRKETDEFGNTVVVVRRFSRLLEGNLFVDNSAVEGLRRLFESLRGKPAVWVGVLDHDELTEPLTFFGFLRDWAVELTYPKNSVVSLTIEGLAQT